MKLYTQAAEAAREAYYQALSAQMAGGKLQVHSDKELLVEVPFPEDPAIANSEGFVYSDLAEQEVVKLGDPVRFVVVSSDGHPILEGTIGVNEDADMPIEQKDSRLFPGMKFGLKEFAFNKA